MTRFLRRRIALATLTTIVLVVTTFVLSEQRAQLRPAAFYSGYLLGAGVLFLAAFQLRKQFVALPFGPAAWWMQAHIYVGLAMCWIFALHVNMHLPDGVFEAGLFLLFVTTAGSGLWGLWMTRIYPRRLAKLRDDFVFERIRGLREQVRLQAHTLVMELLHQKPAPIVGDFYAGRLAMYFEQSRGFWYALRPSSHLRNQLRAEIDDLDRYFSPEERDVSVALRRLIDHRDDLDYHEALQRQLKMWLFVHIGLTYALIIFSALHAAMVHAFAGGSG